MSDSDWELAAHVLTTNYPNRRYIVKLSSGFGATFNIGSPDDVPSLVNVFVPPVTHPHFPYGRVVELD
jgi:hypothetical protein